MQFELSTSNIRDAIRAHVSNTVILKPGQSLEIAFTNGRGEKGVTATVTIVDVHSEAQTTAAAITGTATPEAAVKTAPAPVERLNGRPVETSPAPEDDSKAEPEASEGDEAPAATPSAGLFASL